MADKCPVDHASLKATQTASSSQGEACPVDHSARSSWSAIIPHSSEAAPVPLLPNSPNSLSTDREVSSIPRLTDEKWIYPSEAQFFAAMSRKNHNPHASDMKVVVPIHNVVNERAWADILRWERGRGGEACGGVRLVSFKGRPRDMTPKARIFSLLGYTPPFDRHDWIVDRCGTRVRYVIDFYTGRNSQSGVSFYLDARPALDNWECVKMRAHGWIDEVVQTARAVFTSAPQTPPERPANSSP